MCFSDVLYLLGTLHALNKLSKHQLNASNGILLCKRMLFFCIYINLCCFKLLCYQLILNALQKMFCECSSFSSSSCCNLTPLLYIPKVLQSLHFLAYRLSFVLSFLPKMFVECSSNTYFYSLILNALQKMFCECLSFSSFSCRNLAPYYIYLRYCCHYILGLLAVACSPFFA